MSRVHEALSAHPYSSVQSPDVTVSGGREIISLSPGPKDQVLTTDLPNSSMKLWRSWQWLGLHVDSIVLVRYPETSRHPSAQAHSPDLSVGALTPVPVESAVVGRGLGRGVDGAGPLVNGSAHGTHGAHSHGAAPASPVNGG